MFIFVRISWYYLAFTILSYYLLYLSIWTKILDMSAQINYQVLVVHSYYTEKTWWLAVEKTIITTFVSNDKAQYSSIEIRDDHLLCSFWGASLNLINVMMGTGILGLPLTLHLCRIWVGLALSAGVAYMTCMIMHITILCGQRAHAFDFMEFY